MATSGKRLDWRIIVGIVYLLGVLVFVMAAGVKPGPAILLALPAGALTAAGVRASRKDAPPDDPIPPPA